MIGSSSRQPARFGGDAADVASPDYVGLGHHELPVKQIGRDRQVVGG